MKIIKSKIPDTKFKYLHVVIPVVLIFVALAVYLAMRTPSDESISSGQIAETVFDTSEAQENPVLESTSSQQNVIQVEAEYRARMIDGNTARMIDGNTAFFQERNLDKTFAAIIAQGDNDGLFTRKVLNNVQNCSDWRASISAIIQNQRDKHFNSDTMDKIQVLKEKCQ